MARPGKECRLYGEFIAASVIGPELPGVRIQGDLAIKDQPDLELMIKRAMAVRSWSDKGRDKADVPSVRAADHEERRKPKGYAQFVGALDSYFSKAKKGDLLVVPPNAFGSDAILAELRDDPVDVHYTRVGRFGDFQLPVRRIKKLASIQKRKLPIPILDIAGSPTAFSLIGRSQRPFLYDLAYSNYVYRGNYSAKIDVASEDYNTTDDIRLLAFLNFVAANTKNVTFDGIDDTIDIRTAAFADLGEYAPMLRTNINSPGSLSLLSPFISPLVAMALYMLAIEVGPDAAQAAQDGLIAVTNSLAPADDECTAQVFESTVRQMQLLELDKWSPACEFAMKVHEETGAIGSATVTQDK